MSDWHKHTNTMKNSHIQWTHNTFNPWLGCTKCSPGCFNCYAVDSPGTVFNRVKWGPTAPRIRTTAAWGDPLDWNRHAAKSGIRKRVFCASLADVFEDNPQVAPWRDELHDLIVQTPMLDWLLLTKRPEVALRYYQTRPVPSNVWMGVTAEDQTRADQRIPILEQIPAQVRFLSCEPLLSPLDLNDALRRGGIHWVIVGGESTVKKVQIHRPMDLCWARSIRDQCAAYKTAFFFKQVGGALRSGKKAGGTLLDGVAHLALPN
jgi:protein gp37